MPSSHRSSGVLPRLPIVRRVPIEAPANGAGDHVAASLDGLADLMASDHVEVLAQLAQLRLEMIRLQHAMRPWYVRLWDWWQAR